MTMPERIQEPDAGPDRARYTSPEGDITVELALREVHPDQWAFETIAWTGEGEDRIEMPVNVTTVHLATFKSADMDPEGLPLPRAFKDATLDKAAGELERYANAVRRMLASDVRVTEADGRRCRASESEGLRARLHQPNRR